MPKYLDLGTATCTGESRAVVDNKKKSEASKPDQPAKKE